LGRRIVRVANLPPEIYVDVIRRAMHKFGTVEEITDEKWSNAHRYKVGNDTRVLTMDLNKHIPFQIYVDGYRAPISYAGQQVTCYVCNAVDHMAQECSRRSQNVRSNRHNIEHTWARMEELGGSGAADETLGGIGAPAF
jgi:hypothetical protein